MALYWGNAVLCACAGYGMFKVNPKFDFELMSIIKTLPFYIGFTKGLLGFLRDLRVSISKEEVFVTIQRVIDECNQSLSMNLISYHILVQQYDFNQFFAVPLGLLGAIPPANRYIKFHPLITDLALGINLTILGYSAISHRCYYASFGTIFFGLAIFGSNLFSVIKELDPIEVGSAINGLAYFMFMLCFGRKIAYIPIGKKPM